MSLIFQHATLYNQTTQFQIKAFKKDSIK